ncbi:MAG: PDZ domain-containing protein, partial [Chloroflexota bacterium]|nr:PDZ domain-containing protein [Chloroflexota bacterium]
MSRPAARLLPILAFAAILAAGLLVAAWTTCLPVATSNAAAPDSPPFLGITYLEMTAQAAAHRPGCVAGALVTAVKPGGSADLAGLRTGDTVVKVDDRPLGSDWTLIQGLLDRQAGEQVMVSVRRGDVTVTLPVTLAAR